jgi:hypothetical protein
VNGDHYSHYIRYIKIIKIAASLLTSKKEIKKGLEKARNVCYNEKSGNRCKQLPQELLNIAPKVQLQ